MKNLRSVRAVLISGLIFVGSVAPATAFDLVYSIDNSSGMFDANELNILNTALGQVESMWETMLMGYQPGINIASVPISVHPGTSGLASASFGSSTNQGGFRLATSGFINININEIENFANWQGPGANGLNFIDELLAHETGHALGIGTLWVANGVYSSNTYRYTGQHGLTAYRDEFDPNATFVPVENAGGAGTPNAHWDQRMRSSVQEGNPSDPWSLDPRVGVTDRYGRDRALEFMTGAIDPDQREPFVSRFGVQSMRDLGYTVAEFEDANGDATIDFADLEILSANMGRAGLQIDSIRFGDVNRDRIVDMVDYQLLRTAIPEPSAFSIAVLAILILRLAIKKSTL